MDKGIILKTTAVVSCVVALGITGCQGGNNEAAAVKNKSNIEVSIHNAKGESVDVQGDGKEDIEAVGRRTVPARASVEAGSSDTKPVNGYVGSDRRNGEASSNDNERNEEKGRTDPKADSETEQPEDEDIHAGEKDRGTDSGSESPGAGDGFDAESAVSSISDMESTDSAGRDGGMENDSAVSEYSEVDGSGFTEDAEQYDYDSTDQYEYEDPGTVESGEGSTEGYDESVSELVDSGDAPEEAGSSNDSSDGMEYDGTEESLTYLNTWTISFYCPCVACTNSGNGITASGTYAQPWHTAATDGLEFGTTLYVDGLGYFVVEDRGTSYGWLDIFVADHNEALNLGLQYRDVYLVG